jgi:hypothetical protein
MCCNPPKVISGQLELKITKEGTINVIDTKNNQVIIKNLLTGYSDDNTNRKIHIKDGIKINRIPFSDKMGEATETIFEQDLKEKNIHFKWFIRTFKDKSGLSAKLEITNNANSPLRINRITPLSTYEGKGGILMKSKEPMHYIEMEPEKWAYKRLKKLDKEGVSKFVTGICFFLMKLKP